MEKRKRIPLFYNLIAVFVLLVMLGLSTLGTPTLSSVALEQNARCGQQEHIHRDACYIGDILRCEIKAHTHSENCYLVRLSDNDINWLLQTMDESEDKSLEGVIDSAMVQALMLNDDLTAEDFQPVRLQSEDVTQLNRVIEENQIDPPVVLNEELNDTSLVYAPPQEPEEDPTEPSILETIIQATLATLVTEPSETTEATDPPETTTPATEPSEETQPATPTETTQPAETDPTQATEPETTPDPLFLWKADGKIKLPAQALPRQGQAGLYIYLDNVWACIGVINMDQQISDDGVHYSIAADAVRSALCKDLALGADTDPQQLLHYALQSPADGIVGITQVSSSVLDFGTDGTPRHFYLCRQSQARSSQITYEPVLFHTVTLDYSAADSSREDAVQYVQSGQASTLALEEEYTWQDKNGAAVTALDPVTEETTVYAQARATAPEETEPTEPPETTPSTEPTEPPPLMIVPGNASASAYAVGGSPATGTRAINFYFRLDGKNTFAGTDTLTYNNDRSNQSRKEYCSYTTAVNAYTDGTGVVTNLSTNNIGSTYYFRYNTNGSTSNFSSNAAYASSNVYFANSNAAQYAMLSSSRNSTSPVDFYTVTLDYSQAGGTNQVQYVEESLDATMTLSDDYLWYTDEAGTSPATAADLQNIQDTTTLYARPKARTVQFDSNGGSPVASQTVTYNTTATEPDAPTKAGVTFGGWYRDEALTDPFDFSTPVTGNMTLYAKWLCTAAFTDADGNTFAEPQTVTEGQSLTLPPGYTWTSSTGQVYEGGSSIPITQNITFTGVPKTYTVTFFSGGQVYRQLQDVPHNALISVPEEPSRTDYTFQGWYTDETYSQQFQFDTPVTSDLSLYAKWGFDVTLTYLDADGKPENQEVISCSDGDTVTLPAHYTWTDPANGTVYPGGSQITVSQAMSLSGAPDTYTVSFRDEAGNELYDSRTVAHGKSFLFPDAPTGRVWQASDGSQYIGGDYFGSVEQDLVFTAREATIRISYDVNFPDGAVNVVDSVPTLYGTTSATASDTVSGGQSATVRSLTSNTARREISSGNKESVTYYFHGWTVEGQDVLIPSDTVLNWATLQSYADAHGNVNLMGQWEEGSRINSVTFFVRFDSVVPDTEGNITSRPTEQYTPEIFNTHLGGLPTTDAGELSKLAIADTSADNSVTADQKIRALYGERANGIWMYEFPKDDDVFAYLKQYLEDNPTKRLTVEGETVDPNELDSAHYAIRWYVFKLEGSSWHVDGKLVKREGLIKIFKDFEGEASAFAQAEDGFYILAENGTRDANGVFTPNSADSAHFKQYVLVLDQSTANALRSTYPNAIFQQVDSRDASDHSYLWSLRNITLNEIWRITEHPNDSIEGYSFYAEYSIHDTDGGLTAIAEYGSQATVVGKTFALDEDPDQCMTVDFTNYYYNDHAILLKKEDAATGEGIGSAGFNFIQKDNILSFETSGDSVYSQNPNVENTDIVTAGNGYVSIDGFSYQYGADSNTGDRGRILIRESIVPDGYGWAATVELGLDSNDNVYIAKITTVDGTEVPQSDWSKYAELPRNDVLIIKNHVTELVSVTANKVWNTNVPQDSVEVVLQANGQNAASVFPGLKNAQVVLNAANGWTHTWENLPRYASGKQVSWGIKEVVIGGVPTLSDGTTFANWIPVYSSGTATDTDGDGDTDNWAFTVTNYSKSPKLIVTKVGPGGEGLPGAVFTLEQVELTGGSWQKVSGTATLSQTSDSSGQLTFENLVGTYIYRLTEVKAPDSYIILVDPIVFSVDGDGNIVQWDEEGNQIPITSDFVVHNSPYHLTIQNLIAVELPETGGMGRQVYTLCGLALMLGALLLYFIPHRKERNHRS